MIAAGLVMTSRVRKSAHDEPVALDIAQIDAETVSRCTPSARPALAAGVQLWRDASQWEALPKFEAAAEADPACAAASVLYLEAATHTFPRRREHFRRAREQRSSLSPRERDLLDVLEPTVLDPPDYQESATRAAALLARLPYDPDVRRLLVRALYQLGRLDEALRAADAPAFAALPDPEIECLEAKIEVERRKPEAAADHFSRCLHLSPDSSDCMQWEALLSASSGDCSEAEDVLKHLTSVMPQSSEAYFELGNVLLTTTGDPAAARGAFEQRWLRSKKNSFGASSSPETARLGDEYRLAILAGRLEEALPIAERWNEATSDTNNGRFRGEARIQLIELLRERGKTDEARRLASTSLSEQRVWTGDEVLDGSIEIARLAYLTGALDEQGFRDLRTKWLAKERRAPEEAWLHAYAGLPKVGADIDPPVAAGDYVQNWYSMSPESFSRAADELRIRGVAEAVKHAEAAVHCCLAFSPMGNVHSWGARANAYDAAGDRDAACGAYRDVANRLRASPASATARQANTRLRALSCEGNNSHD